VYSDQLVKEQVNNFPPNWKNYFSPKKISLTNSGVDYIVDCQEIAEPVYVDVDLYEKIILNLISNAYKFTLQGHIAIRLKSIGAHGVQISVEDTGTGNAHAMLR
jgi:signal transduction histidine kinase